MKELHAVVTGAGQGIGAAIAQALAAQGVRLTLMGRRIGPLQALAGSLPADDAERRALAVAVDVTDAAAVGRAFVAAREAHGPVALLVNNAGQADSAPFLRTSAELWQRMLAVNLTGSFLCAQQALPDMLAARRGRIVNIASSAGQRGYPYVSAYVAAKHGVVGLTRALALEVARQGVTVNAVCPGYTETALLDEAVDRVAATTGRSTDAAREAFARTNPQGRLVRPEEVADAVVWLCGDGAGAVNGQCISVAGGEVQ